jgi:1,2-diacylglycerol 3-alpha-glucosyltransferase
VLVIVGDGPDRPRLERHAESGQLGWPVLFTGRIQDAMLDQLYAQAGVVTSASDHEAFGLTLAEGLLSDSRVVASDIPAHAALARLAGPDAPVALVDPRDTHQFTESLTSALRGGRIVTNTLKLPTWADVVADTRHLYSQLRLQGRLGSRSCPDPGPRRL